jgi:DNA-binding transcriptional LysR family regulator
MALSLVDLKVFRSVAAAGSFGRAATRLYLSQPAVSERIARLERDLGKELFQRSTRGVTLTPAGERLLPFAERRLALVDDAVAAVRTERDRARVRVAMHATFAPSAMPSILDALSSQDVEVSATDAHSEDVVRSLDEGLIDIGLVVPCPHPSTITVEPFLRDPVSCVVAPTHELAGQTGLRVRDLAGYPIAFNPWGDGADAFLTLLHEAAIPSPRLHPVSPAETVAALARRGTHVGVLTRSTTVHDLATGTMVTLSVEDLPRWEITLGLAYRNEDADSEPVRTLRDALLTHSDP